MRNLIDMTGRICGDWTVLRKDDGVRSGGAYWICQCKCGTIRPVMGTYLRNGKSTGCGCERRKHAQENMRTWVSSAKKRQARQARNLLQRILPAARQLQGRVELPTLPRLRRPGDRARVAAGSFRNLKGVLINAD